MESIGANRETVPVVEPWDDVRQKQIDFADGDPDVLVIGAGHTGLEMAAHLKHLGVDALVVDKNPRIGDNLIQLHTSPSQPGNHPGYDALPYLNFPTSWPVYPNARKATNLPPFPFDKLANFLEAYAETLELSVWTSSFLTSSSWNDSTKSWEVIISRGGGELKERKMNVKHIVFGTGFGGGVPNMPGVANKDKFKGQVFHSSNFKSAREFRGKKAIVVGACNSGLYNEESNTEYSDRVNASLPFPVIELLQKRVTPALADTVDKELLNNLNKVGFKTNLGPGNAGIFPLLFTKAGGYYIDTGGSQDIIDGKIKLKNGSAIKEFKETGLAFEDGETLEADVIVFATGYGDSKDSIAPVLGKQVVERMTPIWGLDEEGEVNGIWKDTGVEEIKAKLDGTLPPKLERF
ncbi:hypothetical protein D9757_007962 [Collybiopsis confluens]|uniref:Pyridine nucleotide-disulphide oxidoreductase N-terminal domain-containing protein n=1 Tax=Collybiopsis confluens TaxID=2823264 RepID=A0A8H5M3Y2_9AGAR|nr:hypothetical protein D9757_007962 [Collybiopsis confluens]